jgi:hypothetical protein
MTPLDKGERAKHLLEDEVLKAAFHDIRMRYLEQLESVPMSDIDTQHEVTLSLQLLKQLRTQLQKYANELVIDKAKKQQDSFIERMRERFIA